MIGTVGSQIVAIGLVLLLVLGPAFAASWFVLRQKRKARLDRRSPLASHLLRTPGHTLRERLDDARIELSLHVMMLMVLPGVSLAFLYAIALFTDRAPSTALLSLLVVGVLIFSAYQIRVLLRRTAQLDQWRLGLDAEMAAGQELDQTMRQGAVVFHDLVGEHFNVDHVVIAPVGVFAVETKGYRKPNRNGGTEDATVVYDGRVLKFPDWFSDKPLKQAERQARWLGEWLTSATGERIEAVPVLALPGWFVDRQGRGPVMVFSSSELQKHLLKSREARPLTPEQVQRVAHQVEQRCRDVKALYRPDED